MLTLRLLGGLSLTSTTGALGPASTQRRPLALLAVIAAAGSRGVSREQALLYLWPDSTTSGARNTLNQTLYALRRGLNEPNLLGPGPTLRLNSSVVKCDAWAFEAALAKRDLEGAARQYGGPFLEYFGMRGAPEFDRWVDAERSRLAARFQQAAVTLAERAAEHGEHARAIHWWRAVVQQDPLSTLGAAGLISAMAAAGDRPSALSHGREYEARLRSDLGLSLDPHIAKLLGDLDRYDSPSVPLVTGRQVVKLLDEGTGALRYTRPLGAPTALGSGGPPLDFNLPKQRSAKPGRKPRGAKEDVAFQRIVEAAADGIYTADLDGFFTYMNPAGAKMLGVPLDQIVGRSFTEFVRDDLRHVTVDFYARQVETLTPVTYYEFPVSASAAAPLWVGQHVTLLPPGGSPTGIMAITRDITLSKRLHRGRNYLSVRDRATKLLNAASFRVLVDHRIALAQRLGKGFLLVFLHVENAEEVLSSCSVDAADEMLLLIADALRATFRTSDAIARLGVDKFCVLAVDAVEADTTLLEQRFHTELKRLHDPSLDTPWPRAVASAAFYDPALPPSMDVLFGGPTTPQPD